MGRRRIVRWEPDPRFDLRGAAIQVMAVVWAVGRLRPVDDL